MTMRIPSHVAAAALARLREVDRDGRFEAIMRSPAFVPAVQRRIEENVLHAEPISISAAIAALAVSAGASAGAAAVIGAVGSFLVASTISFGLSMAAKALIGSPGSPGSPNISATAGVNDPAVSHNTRQAIPPKRVIVGTARVGGALFFEKVKPPFLYHGLLLSDFAVSAFRGIYIGANLVNFAALPPNTILTPSSGVVGQPNYPTHLRVSLGLGGAGQTRDGLLAAAFPSLDPNFRQQGIARAVFEYNYGSSQDDFVATWGNVQFPNPNLIADGVPVYDPRDPTQLRDVETTWKFSNNAALIQAWYLRARFGGRISSDRIAWDKVAAAADYDDTLIGCLDGTFIRRHTIDGVIALDQNPSSIMQGMLSANRGFIHESGGTAWVSSSRPRDPVLTIHDGLLTGALEFRGAAPKKSVFNRVRCQFISEDREYQQADGPVLDRADLKAADGELLETRLNLPFTRDYRRAERLQKAYLDSSRIGKTITCRCDISVLAESADDLVGSAVRFDSALFAQANGIYFVQTVAFADNFASVDLTLTEYDASIETDWHREIDEKPFTVESLDLS